MTIRLTSDTRVTIDAADMLALITDWLCSCGALDKLEATYIQQNGDGNFEVMLDPKAPDPSPSIGDR